MAILVGCRRSVDALTCTDVSGLPAEDASVRVRIAYVDRTTDTDRQCTSCQQFVTPKDDAACGSCKLLKGPVHPAGSCTLYARRG